MALTIKPKQALGFLPARNCICDSPYCQPVEITDSLMLQGAVSGITENNLVLEGDFSGSSNWVLGAGWTISGGKLHATNITGTQAETFVPIGYVVGRFYLIQIKVTVTSQGSSVPGQGYIIRANGDYLQLPDGITPGNGYNESLTASWIYSPTVVSQDDIEFLTDENTIDFDVDYVRVYEVSSLAMAVLVGGIVVDDITSFSTPNFLKYYFNGELFMNNGALIGGVTNILFETTTTPSLMWELYIDTWDTITSETGCITVKFYDPLFLTNRIRNGDFELDEAYWEFGNFWAMGVSSQACYSGAIGTPGLLEQTVYLMGGNVYTLTFSLSGMQLTTTMLLHVTIDGVETEIEFTGNSIVPRTYEIDLSDYTGVQEVIIGYGVGGANPEITFCVDSVSLLAEDSDSLLTSNCINLQTEHPCTLFLYAINLDNAFGLDYTSGSLQHWLRVYGKIKYSDYPEEAEVFRFSDNSNELLFARSEKEFEVIIGDAPEQIHDCISILRLHDIFQIDGYSFVRAGNYDLNRRRSSDNSQAIFTVREQTGVSSNYNCV